MYENYCTFKISTDQEYFWLMTHLEKLRYTWLSGDKPTYFNGIEGYFTQSEVCIYNGYLGKGRGSLIHSDIIYDVAKLMTNTNLKSFKRL